MTEDQQTYRRATAAALIGLATQVGLTTVVALVGLWAGSPALWAATYYLFGGLPIWLFLALLYNQHRLERLEALESEQLATNSADASAIFTEHGEELDYARRRLDKFYRWGLPVASMVVAGYLTVIGAFWLIRNSSIEAADSLGSSADPKILLALGIAITFVTFIIARYLAGMTRVKQWQLLRGGATFLMGNALVVALVAVAALLTWLEVSAAFSVLAVVVPGVPVIIGIEILLALLMGVYRPRRPGEIPRAPFDSRIFGLLSSPESIGTAIGEAINYQFGFEISRSWFCRLMAKAVTPLTVFALVVLILISSIVVIEPHQQAIEVRCGDLVGDPLGPGLHWKMPWPVSKVWKYPVRRIQQISVGSVGMVDRSKPILWTSDHAIDSEEYLITGATKYGGQEITSTAIGQIGATLPGMALIVADVIVQFRVKNLKQFVTNVTNPDNLITAAQQREQWKKLVDAWQVAGAADRHPLMGKVAIDPCPVLTALANRRVNLYFAQKDIDTVLTVGRFEAGQKLRDSIQQDVDLHELGLEIVFVGVAGIHPPQKEKVANAFHEQIGALQERQTLYEEAERERIEKLAIVAGSYEQALAIFQKIKHFERLEEQIHKNESHGGDESLTRQYESQRREINSMLTHLRGEAAEVLYEAYAYRWKKVVAERSRVQRFQAQLYAFNQAKQYYPMRLYFDVLASGLKDKKKIVVSADQARKLEIRVDLKNVESALGGILEPQ